jgi:protein tyrosine/serine phosphatase
MSGLSELAKQGIKTVINLRKTHRFSRNRIKEKFKGKLRSFYIPFSPYNPNDQIVIHFLKILSDPIHQPAYVHCFHGADRTGTLCAIYRIVCQNWDKEAAILEMKSRGLHWWHKNLVEYIRNLDVSEIRAQLGSQFKT